MVINQLLNGMILQAYIDNGLGVSVHDFKEPRVLRKQIDGCRFQPIVVQNNSHVGGMTYIVYMFEPLDKYYSTWPSCIQNATQTTS